MNWTIENPEDVDDTEGSERVRAVPVLLHFNVQASECYSPPDRYTLGDLARFERQHREP